MNSLRTRLLLVTVLVAAVAVLVSALFSRQVVTSELKRFVGSSGAVDLEPLARQVEAACGTSGSLAAAAPLVERAAAQFRRALLLVDTTGLAQVSSSPPLRNAHVTFGPGGQMTIQGAAAAAAGSSLVLELHAPPSAAVRDPQGRPLATLLALPEPDAPRASSSAFLRSVQRGLWQGALAAIVLGAVLVWLLSARILGPIESLTAAARRMEGGDLSARVVPRGGDEVATLTRRFNAMAESLARSFQLRRQLTHDVAHELRTPLTNLRAQVEALQDGLLQSNAASLASLHEEVMLLTSLVADLEQLAEAEAGALKLDLEALAVDEQLKSAAAAFSAVAAERQLALELVAPGSPLRIRADAMRLAQILRNLIANAITHTPAGGRVSLSAAREGERVAITVADTGAGIPREHLPHVFERFYRADASRTRTTGGAGLGLAIVQQLVLAHGGDVRAESEPGRGTRITLRLPAA